MSTLRPRLCVLDKGSNGYGFHLHGEKGKTGQFIRLVEPDSPAATAGLFAGDLLMFVNGDSVEGESHQQVVARIRATAGSLELIVVDAETVEVLKKHSLKCRKEYVTQGIPLPRSESDHGDAAKSNGTSRETIPTTAENGNLSLQRLSVSSKDSKAELRPRLCLLKKGATGYGFNLHSEKSKPGQYIRAVDENSPADKAGLKPQDKILQVNSMSVAGMQHSEVVAAIKAGGDETSLLLVDRDAEAFFNSCNVIPTEAHLTGPLPEPVLDRGAEEEVEVKPKVSVSSSTSSASSTDSLPTATASSPPPEVEVKPKVSVSSSTSSASSTDSLPTATASSPPPEVEVKPKVSVSSSTSSASSTDSLPTATASSPPPEVQFQVVPAKEPDAGLALSMSLAQAKERAHQKRSAKKVPAMDWRKRNELFSNL